MPGKGWYCQSDGQGGHEVILTGDGVKNSGALKKMQELSKGVGMSSGGSDYGEDMIRHWLLGELRAAAENVELEGGRHFYRGNRSDYLIDIVVTPVSKTVRLSED